MAVEVAVLGGVTARRAGRPVKLGGRVPARVLAVLAAHAPWAVPLPVLIDEVWGGAPPRTAEKSLRVHVGRLRTLLGPEAVETTMGGYRIGTPVDLDLEAYRIAVEAAQVTASTDPAAAMAHLETAFGLWRGRPFADVADDDEWPASITASLVEHHRDNEELHSRLLLDVGLEADHLALLRQRVADQPLRERRWVDLITALHRSGLDAEAIRAYEACRRTMADELGAMPGAAVQAAYDDALLRPGEATGGQTPAGRLIARAKELSAVESLLEDHSVVTVLGIGGIGKSRLAAEVVTRLRQRGLRAWSLAVPDTDMDDRLARELTEQMGVTLPDEVAALDALAGRLVGVDLLVLDGADRCLDPARALIARLVRRRPRLRILVTSREPLVVPGEASVTLRALPLPAVDEAWVDTAAELLARHRGLSVKDLGTADAQAVLADCRKAAGIPLLLELAARTGGVVAVADDDDRSVQRSVRQLFASLDRPGQDLASAIGALPGGVSPALGHALGATERELRHLAWLGLATTSLVGDVVRYDMLDPVREALHDVLDVRARATVVERARDHVRRLGREVHHPIEEPPRHDRLPALDAEGPTIRHLLVACRGARLDLTEDLADHLGLRGQSGSGLTALDDERRHADADIVARSVLTTARIGRFGGNLDEIASELLATVGHFRDTGQTSAAVSSALFGVAAHVRRDLDVARQLADYATSHATTEWLGTNAEIATGFVVATSGRPQDGLETLHSAELRHTGVDAGNAALAAYLSGTIGAFILAREAIADFGRARALAESIGDLPLAALCSYGEAELLRRRGATDLAKRYVELAARCERAGLPPWAGQAHRVAGTLFLHEGELDAAAAELLQAVPVLVRERHPAAVTAIAGLAIAVAPADPDLTRRLAAAARSDLPVHATFPLTPEDHAETDRLLAGLPDVESLRSPSTDDVLALVDEAASVTAARPLAATPKSVES